MEIILSILWSFVGDSQPPAEIEKQIGSVWTKPEPIIEDYNGHG